MTPIDKAISEVKFRIPKPILEAAFIKQPQFASYNRISPISLEYRIREEVIYPRVMVDVNLVGGTEVHVPLSNLPIELTPDRRTIYRIPLERTQGRRITRVYSIVVGTGLAGNTNAIYSSGGSAMLQAARGLISSHLPIPNVSNAKIRLIGENTILVDYEQLDIPHLFLRCVVENDEELNNLPPTAWDRFSRLVELATKAHVYNTLIISIDEAQLQGGQQLGRFLSIVEEYSDANELYNEYLNDVWKKTAILSDDLAKKRHIARVVGGLH